MDKIIILLPVHNRIQTTKRFITALAKQSYTNYVLVLIDDGCTDGTAEMVKRHIKNLEIVSGKGNWWWAGALQEGVNWIKRNKRDKDDLVLIINDDTTFETDFLEQAVKILEKKEKMLLLATSYDRVNNSLIDKGISIDWRYLTFNQAKSDISINCFSTRGLFLRVNDVLEIGDFHRYILPHYFSDYEYTYRAYKKGYRLLTNQKLKLWLDNSTTGYHSIERKRNLDFIKKSFSKKSPTNPFYFIIFIILASPWKWKIRNILKIAVKSIGTIKKMFSHKEK